MKKIGVSKYGMEVPLTRAVAFVTVEKFVRARWHFSVTISALDGAFFRRSSEGFGVSRMSAEKAAMREISWLMGGA